MFAKAHRAVRPTLNALSTLGEEDVERWKGLSEIFLYAMYGPVSEALGQAHPDNDESDDALETMASNLNLTKRQHRRLMRPPTRREARQMDRIVWQPVARSTVLILIDTLIEQLRLGHEAVGPLAAGPWVELAMATAYEPDRFHRLTGCEEHEHLEILTTSAQAIIDWWALETPVPFQCLGVRAILGTQGNGITCQHWPART